MKNLKNSPENVEEINYNIRDLEITDIVPNIIDNFMVTILDGHHTLLLPSTTTGLQLNAWSREKGGVFSKDVLKHSLGQKCGQYVLIGGNDLNCIARLITEEELFSFETLKLVDGKIKDIPYMILRNLKEGDTLINTKKISVEKDFYSEVDSIILSAPKVISHDEDPDYHVGSVSLFNE
jgi:hypothetical protein